ncbi:MAG: trypsin-like peptidase domain-containing protein [Planctomycetes bacterium]|nr:trypsin-like peptidase domain-containing protein [Planctomycetota bacterium]
MGHCIRHSFAGFRALTLVLTGLSIGNVCPSAWAAPPTKYDFGDLEALEKAFTELAQKVQPSVVAIRGYRGRSAGHNAPLVKVPSGQGSGFIIDADGLVATNRHVIEESDSWSVTLFNGDVFEAAVVQTDARSDLAVLKIDAHGLRAAPLGSSDELKVGQWTFSGGNPFGLANNDGKPSISFGIISALGRELTDELKGDPNVQYYGNLVEFSANINPGNSGGPLFNLNGDAIGIVTAIKLGNGTRDGCGFAIPIDAGTRRVFETLKSGKQVEYGFLGVTVEDIEAPKLRHVADTGMPRGAKIVRIEPADGPGGRGGLKPDDIVVQFNGVPIQSKDQLIRLVGYTPIGTEAELVYFRRGVRRTAMVTLGDRAKLLGWAK